MIDSGSLPSPGVEGPITAGMGRPFVASTFFDLARVGYSESEYFLSGSATAYTAATPLTGDGKWNVARGEAAAYRTRVVVYRPIDALRFNGTVFVE